MIRRTFLKALCASPLGFLIPGRRRVCEKGHCQGAARELKSMFRVGKVPSPDETSFPTDISTNTTFSGYYIVSDDDELMVTLKV